MTTLYAVAALSLSMALLGSGNEARANVHEVRVAHADVRGNRLFNVFLNEDAIAVVDDRNEPAARNPRDVLNNWEFRGWHKAKTRKLVKDLEKQYGIQAVSMTSYLKSSMGAFLSEDAVKALLVDPRIEDVVLVYEGDDYSTWTDQPSNGETIPWGKRAIGTNDALSTGNVVYLTQSPNGTSTHYIYAGNTPNPSPMVATVSQNVSDTGVIAKSLGNLSARYVRIYTATSPSWVAWYEAEFFGY